MTPTPSHIKRLARLICSRAQPTSDPDYAATWYDTTTHDHVAAPLWQRYEKDARDYYLALEADGWQMVRWEPWETAPRDGTIFLALIRYQVDHGRGPSPVIETIVCRIDDAGDMETPEGDHIGWVFDEVAMHWCTLPKPPGEGQ